MRWPVCVPRGIRFLLHVLRSKDNVYLSFESEMGCTEAVLSAERLSHARIRCHVRRNNQYVVLSIARTFVSQKRRSILPSADVGISSRCIRLDGARRLRGQSGTCLKVVGPFEKLDERNFDRNQRPFSRLRPCSRLVRKCHVKVLLGAPPSEDDLSLRALSAE